MDSKTLNSLDGSSVLAQVIAEKIETQRKSYKVAIKNAIFRNDKAQESLAKVFIRAEKTKAKLDALVKGGMEGFLNEIDKDDKKPSIDISGIL